MSNAGRKRGRAKGIGRKKDLNRGQIIGVGKTNMLWPGLNAPVIRGRELVKHQKLPDNPDWYDDTICVCVCAEKLSANPRIVSGKEIFARSETACPVFGRSN